MCVGAEEKGRTTAQFSYTSLRTHLLKTVKYDQRPVQKCADNQSRNAGYRDLEEYPITSVIIAGSIDF